MDVQSSTLYTKGVEELTSLMQEPHARGIPPPSPELEGKQTLTFHLQSSTASYATMLWEGKDNASDDANQHTAFQAAMAWQSNDSSSSSSHTDSPTGFNAAALFLADSLSTYSSPPATFISTAFPTASDAADVFLSSSETDSVLTPNNPFTSHLDGEEGAGMSCVIVGSR